MSRLSFYNVVGRAVLLHKDYTMGTSEYKVNQNTSAKNSESSAKKVRGLGNGKVPRISISSSSTSEGEAGVSFESLTFEKEFLRPKSPSIQSKKSFVKESLVIQEEDKTLKKKADRRKKKKAIAAKCSFAFVGMITVFVLAASVTMLIYQINREECPNEINLLDSIENGTVETIFELNCQELKGDGFCDDEINNEFCNYDGGDCCDQNLDRSMCTDCFCHIEYFQTTEYLNCPQVNHNANGEYSFAYHGDGHCDEEFNNYEKFFDAGDCCLPNPTIFFEGEVKDPINQYVIPKFADPPRPCNENECVCIPNNLVCNTTQLGDGICQDFNNGPLCDHDLGDCCLKFWNFYPDESKGNCCNCFCHLGEAAAGVPIVG